MATTPTGWRANYSGHHWLKKSGHDGRFICYVVLMWNPSSRTWCHSGMDGVEGCAINMERHKYEYVSHIEMPDIDGDAEDLITQLRAELAAEREAREASEEWADIGINLFSEILYEFDACVDDGELTDDPMENYLIIIRQAIKNATRRNK